MFKLDLEKAEEPEINIRWVMEKAREFQKKKSLLLLYWICQRLSLCGSQQTVENSERDGNTRHLTCLLRNLYADQERTVRTGQGTTDWFQIGKGLCQGCMLSPCLFNFYVTCQAGWSTSWSQDCWEKYQKLQICRCHHAYGTKWRGAKEPVDERREWKSWLKTQHSKN